MKDGGPHRLKSNEHAPAKLESGSAAPDWSAETHAMCNIANNASQNSKQEHKPTTTRRGRGKKMFSLNTSQSQPAGGSLFGGSTQNKPLFGASTSNNTSQPTQGASLFGGSLSQQPQPQMQNQQTGSSSLFGASAQAPTTSGSLFSQTQPAQSMQQQQGGGGLFGSLAASTQHANPLGASFLGGSTSQQQQNLSQSRLGTSLAETMNRREFDRDNHLIWTKLTSSQARRAYQTRWKLSSASGHPKAANA